MSILLFVVATIGVTISVFGEAISASEPLDLNGLFSITQTEKGSSLFAGHCAQCHSAEQASKFFSDRWASKRLGDFYDHIHKTMPPENSGRLQGQDYLDITAFFAFESGFIPGEQKISVEALQWRNVTITPSSAHNQKRASDLRSVKNLNWPTYRGDQRSQGYSPASLIDHSNVKRLKTAWRWFGRNFGPAPEMRNITTPLMVKGRLYFTAGLTRNVVAIDAASGETLWIWRPDENSRFDSAPRKGSGRGVAYWPDRNGGGRIFVVTPGFQLVALDALTGLPKSDFGSDGHIDLRQGLRLATDRDLDIGSSSPPLVMGDIVVVGPAHASGVRPVSKRNVKGDVRAYHARTGDLLWTFHTIPQASNSSANDNWKENSNNFTGNAGVWAPISGDAGLGLIYLPVESPTNDYYGGERPGDNRYANSLVCLDINTGKIKWHFQFTHHDIWDWDLPTAPILIDIPKAHGAFKAVAQITKQALVYVFDRETGEPLWPIVEQPAPQSDVPGEKTSATQPFPTKPPPFDRQGMTVDDLIDFTPQLRNAALKAITPYRLGQFYAAASLVNSADKTQGTLTLPSSIGGANWEGGVVDPETGFLYVASMSLPTVLALEPAPELSDSGYVGVVTMPTVDGLPLVKPPWGRLTAIDLKSGEHVWVQANGNAPEFVRRHTALQGISLGRTGKQTRSGLLVTKTLLFAGEGWGGESVLWAYDKHSGEVLAEIPLPGSQSGLPMTYVWQGRQYIVMAVGDGKNPAELVALALP